MLAPPKTLNQTFQQRLRILMRQPGKRIPAKVIAARSGYSIAYIRQLLRTHNPNPTLLVVSTLASALDVSVSWLLGLDGECVID